MWSNSDCTNFHFGAGCFILLIDDHSKYVDTYPMDQTSHMQCHTIPCSKWWLNTRPVGSFKLHEVMKKASMSVLTKKSIFVQMEVAGSQQLYTHNTKMWAADWMKHTPLHLVISMIYHQNLTKCLWGESHSTGTYLMNKMSSRELSGIDQPKPTTCRKAFLHFTSCACLCRWMLVSMLWELCK